MEGGDLYESQQKFHEKVLNRSEVHIEKQMQFITCPVLELDATLAMADIVNTIYEKWVQINIA